MIRTVGALVGSLERAEALARRYEDRLAEDRRVRRVRPKVYFEEWDNPLISGIGWVSEQKAAKDRLVVIAAASDIILVR